MKLWFASLRWLELLEQPTPVRKTRQLVGARLVRAPVEGGAHRALRAPPVEAQQPGAGRHTAQARAGSSTNAVARTVSSVAVTDSSFAASSLGGIRVEVVQDHLELPHDVLHLLLRRRGAVAVVARGLGEVPLDGGLHPPDDGLALRRRSGWPRESRRSPCGRARRRAPPAPCAASRARSGTIRTSSASALVSIRLSAWTARRCPDVWTPARESPSAPFLVTIAAHRASAPSATTASDMPATAIRARSFGGGAGCRVGAILPYRHGDRGRGAAGTPGLRAQRPFFL